MTTDLTRRVWLAAAMASLAAAGKAWAGTGDPLYLEWEDLIPADQRGMGMESLRLLGIVQHSDLQSIFVQETDAKMVTHYNGKRVRLPGYAVPLEFEGTAITTFLLVPFVGACIHVPPPPPNQLVFVEAQTPFVNKHQWDPVFATGVINTVAVGTELAEIGYAMAEAEVVPYSENQSILDWFWQN